MENRELNTLETGFKHVRGSQCVVWLPIKPEKKKSAKDNVFEEFEMVVTSYQRSFELFMDIVERNQDRIFFEEDMKMVIKGRMAIYRIDVQSWINALRNPFAPTSFDPVQVHPSTGS